MLHNFRSRHELKLALELMILQADNDCVYRKLTEIQSGPLITDVDLVNS